MSLCTANNYLRSLLGEMRFRDWIDVLKIQNFSFIDSFTRVMTDDLCAPLPIYTESLSVFNMCGFQHDFRLLSKLSFLRKLEIYYQPVVDFLPDGLEKLTLRASYATENVHTQIACELPAGLTTLCCSWTTLVSYTKNWPPLRKLRLTISEDIVMTHDLWKRLVAVPILDVTIKRGDRQQIQKLPPNLTHLTCDHRLTLASDPTFWSTCCPKLQSFAGLNLDVIPNGLSRLDLCMIDVAVLDLALMPNLAFLRIRKIGAAQIINMRCCQQMQWLHLGNGKKNFPQDLPDRLLKLKVENIPFADIKLPQTLRYLNLDATIACVPDEVATFYYKCHQGVLPILPAGLRILRVYHTMLPHLASVRAALPRLQELHILQPARDQNVCPDITLRLRDCVPATVRIIRVDAWVRLTADNTQGLSAAGVKICRMTSH